MIKINLLSERRQATTKARGPSIDLGANVENMLYIGILVVAVFFCGYKWWSLEQETTRVLNEITVANRRLQEVEEGLRIIKTLEAKKAQIDKQVDIIATLKRARSVPVTLMNELNANLPDFLWLNSMSESGNQISFAGRATTQNAPANLYNNLTSSAYFAGVTLNQIRKEANGVNFSLTCTFLPGGIPAPPQG
jgi:type IV pilus assembly protein PilN